MIIPVPLHGIGSRQDLPLPFSFVVTGAAVAVVVSFLVLFVAWREPRYTHPGGIALPRLTRMIDHPGARLAAQLAVAAVYAWAALALFAGKDRLTNPAFGFVYAWMWVGLVPLSLVLGTFWRATNPLRTLHRGLCLAARTDPDEGLLELPQWVGIWPALVSVFGFGFLELVQPDRTSLAVLRVWALAWLVLLILGAVLFGRRWIAAADPFEAYATAVAQVSIWRRINGEIRLVSPLANLHSWTPPAGTPAVLAVLLGSTAFDSFARTSWWIKTVQASAAPATLWATAGLLTMTTIIYLSFSAAAAWMGRYRGGDGPAARHFPRLMAASLVPIVVGYAVAHYTTLLVIEGQRTAINMSDPLGLGWNVFGSAEMGVNAGIFNHSTVTAVVQLAAILLGHLVGIVAAHERALALVRHDAALRAQWPMLLAMVCFTCAGLVLLFSP